MQRIITERYLVDQIPVLTMASEGVEQAPLVFFYHGCGGTKEDGIALGYQLAEQGFYFVAVDAYLHGERLDQRLVDAFNGVNVTYPAATGLDVWELMFESIYHTGNELYQLIDHFAQDQRADVERVGVTGLSMGGYIAFYLAGFNAKVQVTVPMIGLGTFAERSRDVLEETMLYDEWASELEPLKERIDKMQTFITQMDPHPMMRKYAPKPLLMLNGDRDVDQPKSYSVNLHKELQFYYREHPDQLKIKIYNDAAHQVTPEMRFDAVEWFKCYL